MFTKKRKNNIRFTLFFLFTFSLVPLSGCQHLQNFLNAAFQKPTLHYQKMHLKNMSFKGMNLDFEFLLKNPNDVGVTLSKLAYQLDLDGNTLFKGTTSRKIEMKPNGSSAVHMPFGVEFAKFVKSMLTFFQKRDHVPYKLTMAFGLQTPIGEVVIPFTKEDKIAIPKVPDVALQNVDVKVVKTTKTFLGRTISIPTGAQLNFRVGLKQKGKFPITLRGLNYNVQMGGVSLLKANTKVNALKVGGAQVINIPITLGKEQAIPLLKAIVAKKFDFKFLGNLDLGSFKLPLNFGPGSTKMNLPDLGALSTLLKFLG